MADCSSVRPTAHGSVLWLAFGVTWVTVGSNGLFSGLVGVVGVCVAAAWLRRQETALIALWERDQLRASAWRATADMLEEAREEAERANTAKSAFLAVMSHELRTPLNGVMGTTSLLLETELDANQTELAQVCLSSSRHLLLLLNDLLDLARIEEGMLELNNERFQLGEVAKIVVDLYHAQAEKNGVDLRWSVSDETPAWVMGDAHRVRQILLNLLGNALKFTRSGHVALRISCPVTEGGLAVIEIEVEDTGPGITPAFTRTIFERFTQEDTTVARKHGGSGLGLSICQELTHLMGGDIGVRSTVGVGSVFWMRIPLRVAEAPALVSPVTRLERPIKAYCPRILVVDDNRVNRMLARRMLEGAGYEVAEAEGGRQAVEMAERGGWDAILMDLQMPGMDGFTATKTILALPSPLCDVAIIAFTANASAEDRQRTVEVGMKDVITKPVQKQAMLDTIDQHLRCGTPLTGNRAAAEDWRVLELPGV